MGNFQCVPCKIIILPSCVRDASVKKPGKALTIVKPDGKILEFKSPILVKDVLVDFSGYVIGSSHHHHLPLNYELKMGRVYYMLPSLGSGHHAPATNSSIEEDEKEEEEEDSDKTSSTSKRIRIVITKKQLQQLLSKQVSMEELITQLEKRSCSSSDLDSPTTWKPTLEAIPEGVE